MAYALLRSCNLAGGIHRLNVRTAAGRPIRPAVSRRRKCVHRAWLKHHLQLRMETSFMTVHLQHRKRTGITARKAAATLAAIPATTIPAPSAAWAAATAVPPAATAVQIMAGLAAMVAMATARLAAMATRATTCTAGCRPTLVWHVDWLSIQASGADVAHAQQQDGLGGAGTVPFGRIGTSTPTTTAASGWA